MNSLFIVLGLIACHTAVGQVQPPPEPANQSQAPAVKSKFLSLLNASDSVILLLDQQTGLFQTVNDIPVRDLRINVGVLAKLAALRGIPLITTASEPNGPNGPLIPELADFANATFVRRHGEISAWENPDFVRAVENTQKKTLIMAGVWTSVCVSFPAIQALAEGYKVYVVIDASGDLTAMSSLAAQLRMQQAGVILVSTNVLISELQRTWNRPDANDYGALYAEISPNYAAVMDSFKISSANNTQVNTTITSNSTTVVNGSLPTDGN
jgi:nicotinamidase-related amidase